ncbi:hypothetical protein [Arcanobacterium buesumense]|uniref:Core-binding (CB) domain-containing protein n=1 Tax=Arcanobacterium buesumense TaxID=2722751 RepID=A0A6H2EN40_9ACTO|nr:hypothetical protein [Arcanobacterium buesumense]QJC22495.1 hypothetical protein HC352_08270 [Arcanobacterium buesumense]
MNNTTTQTILSDWTLAMRAQALSPLTIHERIRVSNCLCEYVDATPVTITTDQIIEWVSLLPSAVTKWTYFTHIKALFTWLEITRRRTDNPLLGLKAPDDLSTTHDQSHSKSLSTFSISDFIVKLAA